MANSSSEDKTDTLPERPTRIQPYQFEPARQDFERGPVFHGVCEIALTEVLTTQMGVMWCSKKVSLFELYKFNPLSPHCGSIVWDSCVVIPRVVCELLQFAATQ